MQTNLFPQSYNMQINEKTKQKIDLAKQHSSSQLNSIRTRHKPESWMAFAYAFFIGLAVGFLACSGVCIGFDDIESGLATWIIVFVLSMIIGAAIDIYLKIAYKLYEENLANQLVKGKTELEAAISRINVEAEKEKTEYYTQFEKNAQDMSVLFAESELAKEVIEWMTEGFCRTIDSVNRESHIEIIRVPFDFNVFDNKITCNLGTFDFEIKRCRNLKTPLEQTALARAIASAIQLNIIMKYPKDVSGTDISIDISYDYTSRYSATTITYVAPNGNFKAVRGW